MTTKLFRIGLLSMVLTFFTFAPSFAQDCLDITQRDEISDFQSKIEKASASTLFIFVESSIVLADQEDPFDGPQAKVPFDNIGRGVVVRGNGRDYIVTLSHIVRFDADYVFNILKQSPKYKEQIEDKVVVSKSHKVFVGTSYSRSEAVEIEETKPIAAFSPFTMESGKDDAIVLMEVPDKLRDKVEPAKLVSGEKCLGVNTAVWQLGGELARDSDLGFNRFDVISTSVTNTASDKFFKVLRPSLKGASGSPVFAYHNDKIRVVGITQGWIGTMFENRKLPTQGLIYKIDPVVEYLDQF